MIAARSVGSSLVLVGLARPRHAHTATLLLDQADPRREFHERDFDFVYDDVVSFIEDRPAVVRAEFP